MIEFTIKLPVELAWTLTVLMLLTVVAGIIKGVLEYKIRKIKGK